MKTPSRIRVGYCEPSTAVVSATKMRPAKAVASTTEMAMTSTEMPAAEMAAAMTTTVTTAMAAASVAAAASAESRARQQRRQNKDRNSDYRFGHGTLPAPRRGCCGAGKTPIDGESSARGAKFHLRNSIIADCVERATPGGGWSGGAEGALGGNWTAKVEYLNLDFGNIAHVYPAALATNLADSNVHISTRVRDNVFRVGLNYHFACGLPVVTASY